MVKNYTEVIVDYLINDLILNEEKNFFACTCDACMDNIRAITLNALKPFYITCKVGEVFGDFQSKEIQNRVDVLTEVVRAKEIVAKNPHHGEINEIQMKKY
ncbi:MAG: late competence development ComFB family protein [Oscillospiraceae bacterium]